MNNQNIRQLNKEKTLKRKQKLVKHDEQIDLDPNETEILEKALLAISDSINMPHDKKINFESNHS